MLDVSAAVVASIFPDYFEMATGIKHRSKVVHNFLIPLPLLVASLLYPIQGLFGFAFGYFYHLVLDVITVYGVYIGGKRIRGFLMSRSLVENLAVILAHYTVLLYWFFMCR